MKEGISNSFKRVASSGFGIGRYLYNIKNCWFPIKKQNKNYLFITTPRLDYETDSKNESILITFVKYKGLTIKDIYNKDKKYIQYLIEKAKDKEIVTECKLLSA